MMVTLILLPGLDGTGTLFDTFVAALGTEFNVKVVSYPTTEPLDYSELEAIARSALPAEGPFVILGESFSGPIAVSLAASGSSQLKGLVLCCTFVRNPRPVFAIFKPLLGLLPIAFAPVSILIRLFLGRASTAALLSAITLAFAQVSPSVLRARIRGILSVDVSSKFAELNVPVLYLRAAQDHLVPQTASQLVTQLCPRAQVAQLEAPHYLLQAAPSEAAKIIAAFIRGVE